MYKYLSYLSVNNRNTFLFQNMDDGEINTNHFEIPLQDINSSINEENQDSFILAENENLGQDFVTITISPSSSHPPIIQSQISERLHPRLERLQTLETLETLPVPIIIISPPAPPPPSPLVCICPIHPLRISFWDRLSKCLQNWRNIFKKMIKKCVMFFQTVKWRFWS